MELKDRERKVDVSSLPQEQVDQLSEQIGSKVRGICDEAADRINAILAIYGMSAKLQIAIGAEKKKAGRKSKQNNLKK